MELCVQQSQCVQVFVFDFQDELYIDSGSYVGVDVIEGVSYRQEDVVIFDLQESVFVLVEGLVFEGFLFVESLRVVVEVVVLQIGFIYDESMGLYFDYSIGFYYDFENQLYYDSFMGIYYYCDVESGWYQFYFCVDLQFYQIFSIKLNRERRLKKRRKELGFYIVNEEKDLSLEDQKVCSVEYINCSEDEYFGNVKKKVRIDIFYKSSFLQFMVVVSGDIVEFFGDDNLVLFKDERIGESESELEEGEIIDFQSEKSYDGDSSSGDREILEEFDDEDEERIWLFCICVIVIRFLVLQMGLLFIIIVVSLVIIGREKDMEYIVRIFEVVVSKFYVEVYFDYDL